MPQSRRLTSAKTLCCTRQKDLINLQWAHAPKRQPALLQSEPARNMFQTQMCIKRQLFTLYLGTGNYRGRVLVPAAPFLIERPMTCLRGSASVVETVRGAAGSETEHMESGTRM